MNDEICKKIDIQKKKIIKINNLIKKFKKQCNTKKIIEIKKKYEIECKKYMNNYKKIINKGQENIHTKYNKIINDEIK